MCAEAEIGHLFHDNPERNPVARACARELAVVALAGAVNLDWDELLRVARLPEYNIVKECEALVRELANELKIKSPFHPD
jgi:hypothetical protein